MRKITGKRRRLEGAVDTEGRLSRMKVTVEVVEVLCPVLQVMHQSWCLLEIKVCDEGGLSWNKNAEVISVSGYMAWRQD